MSDYISDSLRRKVIDRANWQCEYCKLPDTASFFTFHIDHVVSLKHSGETTLNNLAYACPICNIAKGPDVATFLDDIRTAIRFYNPRIDSWQDHFSVDKTGLLNDKTDIGRATIKILGLNHPDAIIERMEMIRLGLL
ncbi:HNH endonuclease [Fibrella aquatilis]|uniref:HNH endonuclease n=1 Tax=Fibrella aquatilis TaxID=2817059 RepID=A0A939G3R3_9BACT|nr:HNH endonuclease [Fibrella aquatilis]MBO0930658.1 HNH endonuclease [Fibrella aquatilis]